MLTVMLWIWIVFSLALLIVIPDRLQARREIAKRGRKMLHGVRGDRK